jgi:segregation and condensation protein B
MDVSPVLEHERPDAEPLETEPQDGPLVASPADDAPSHDAAATDGLPDMPLVFIGEALLPLTAALESLLFVADKPVEPAQLARALQIGVEQVEAGLALLAHELVAAGRGLRLQVQGTRVRLVSRPDAARAIEEFLHLDLSTRLSGPALETLAVVAYRQPVTRAQIEAVRGVDCGAVLRTLVQRGLVEEVGRLEGVGRPYLYGITEHFLHHFGLMALSELPPLPEADHTLLAAVSDAALDGIAASPVGDAVEAADDAPRQLA